MNADNFPDFLEQPSHLFQMPYEELKSLVMQYPYCQNLWYLLLKKSMLENHRDFDRNLHMAATVSPDRAYLFQQIRKVQLNREVQENYELSEDFLELMDLNEVREPLEAPPIVEKEEQSVEKVEKLQIDPGPPIPDEDIPAPAFSVPSPVPDDETSREEIVEPVSTVEENIPSPSEPLPSFDLDHLVGDIGTGIDLIADLPEPLDTSNSVVQSFNVTDDLIMDMASVRDIAHSIQIVVPPPTPKKVEEEVVVVAVEEQLIEKSTVPPDEVTIELEETQQPSTSITQHEAPIQSKKKKPATEPSPTPLPKSSFSSWLKQFQPPQVSTQLHTLLETEKEEQKKKKKKKKKKNKKPLAVELADRSVEDHEVVSETLAWLLTSQGHFQKALHTYEVLLRNEPERSEYFTKKIQEVRNKMTRKG